MGAIVARPSASSYRASPDMLPSARRRPRSGQTLSRLRVSPAPAGGTRVPESADERTFAPSCDRRAGHAVGRRRRGDRDERRPVGELRPAPPRDRPDLPVRRAGDLGSRAGQPDRPADDPRRAHLVHRDARRRPGSRSSTRSPSRSRTRRPSSSLALVLAYPSGGSRRVVDRVAVAILAIGATALNILFSTSLPLIADKSSGLYGGLALATMTTVVVVRRWLIAPPRARGSWRRSSSPGMVFLAEPDHQPHPQDRRAARGRRGDPPRRPGPGAGGDPGRPADRLLSPERAAVAGARRCDPGPDVPLHARRPVRRFDGGRRTGDACGQSAATGRAWLAGACTSGCSPRRPRPRSPSADRALETGELQAYDFSLDVPTGTTRLRGPRSPRADPTR